jgi:hypothetical protein
MKKILLAVCFTFALAALAPVSVAGDTNWPWRHHDKNSASAKTAPAEKGKKDWLHREKSREKAREKSAREEIALNVSPGPRSVDRLHPQPGPAGAGAR